MAFISSQAHVFVNGESGTRKLHSVLIYIELYRYPCIIK